MALLIALVNIIGWGLIPLTVKDSPQSQIAGMGIGASATALIIYLFTRPAFDAATWAVAFVAGMLWTIGQMGQFISYTRIGVSGTIPLSAGFQLVGNSLIGVLIFGEWASTQAKLFGFLGILALVVGVAFTSLTDKGTAEGNKQNQTSTMIILALTTLGYITSSSIPKALKGDGVMIFLGQTIGMMIATFIYLVATKQLKVLKEKESYQVIPAGVIFAIAALSYIISVQMNGVNLAFVMSQLCVVISTLGGIVFLHEQKTKKGYIYTAIGLVLIVAGAVLTSVF